MKSKEIQQRYNVDLDDFLSFLSVNEFDYSNTFTGFTVPDEKIEDYIMQFRQVLERNQRIRQELLIANEENKRKEEERKQAEAERIRIEEERKRQAMANMLITSGFTFDGYRIVKYSGYISGDDAIQIPRGTSGFFCNATDVGASLMASLVKIRRNALNELKEAAYDLGCNAVIGVDFDYLTLDPETANTSGGTTYLPYVFGVTANGNAVIIEKKED